MSQGPLYFELAGSVHSVLGIFVWIARRLCDECEGDYYWYNGGQFYTEGFDYLVTF